MSNLTIDSELFLAYCQYQASVQSALVLARPDSGFASRHSCDRKGFDRAWSRLSPSERNRWTQKFQQGYETVALAQKEQLARACLTNVELRVNRHAA